MALERYASTKLRCGSYHLNSRVTGDTGDHFSDGKYSGIHHADRGAFYAWPLDPLLLYRSQKRMNCSWIALAFASAVVNTDREELG